MSIKNIKIKENASELTFCSWLFVFPFVSMQVQARSLQGHRVAHLGCYSACRFGAPARLSGVLVHTHASSGAAMKAAKKS